MEAMTEILMETKQLIESMAIWFPKFYPRVTLPKSKSQPNRRRVDHLSLLTPGGEQGMILA